MGAQIVADRNSNNNKCNTHKNLYAHWAEERNGKKGACVCQRRPKGSPLHTPPTHLALYESTTCSGPRTTTGHSCCSKAFGVWAQIEKNKERKNQDKFKYYNFCTRFLQLAV